MDSRMETLQSIIVQIKKIIQYSKNPKLTDTLNRVLRRLLESQRFLTERQDATGKTLTAKKIGFYILKTYRMTQERTFNNVLMKFMPGQYRSIAGLFSRLDKLARELLSFDYKHYRKAEADVGIIHGYLVRGENAFRSASQASRDPKKTSYLVTVANEMRNITAMIYLGRNPDKSICGFQECVDSVNVLYNRLEEADFQTFLSDMDPRITARLQEIKNNYPAAFRNYMIRKFSTQKKSSEGAVTNEIPNVAAMRTQEIRTPLPLSPRAPEGSQPRPQGLPERRASNLRPPSQRAGALPPRPAADVTSQLRPLKPGEGIPAQRRPAASRSYPSPAAHQEEVRGAAPQGRPDAISGRRPQRAAGPLGRENQLPPPQANPSGSLRNAAITRPSQDHPPTTVLRSAQRTQPLKPGHPQYPKPEHMPQARPQENRQVQPPAGARRSPDGFFREVNRQRPDSQSPGPSRVPPAAGPPRPRSFEDEVISLLDKSKRTEMTSRLPDPKTSFLNPDVLKKPRSFLSEAIQKQSGETSTVPPRQFRPGSGGPGQTGPRYHNPNQPPPDISGPYSAGRDVTQSIRHEQFQSPGVGMIPPAESSESSGQGISIADIVKKSKGQSQARKAGCLPAFMGGGAAVIFIIIKLIQLFIR